MKLFVNDTPVAIVDLHAAVNPGQFERIIDARQESLTDAKLKDDVLVTHASEAYIRQCLDEFSKKKVKKLDSITFSVTDRRVAIDAIKQQYKIIKAAGGVVRKEGKVLLIYRLGKWDLPKGKLREQGEALGRRVARGRRGVQCAGGRPPENLPYVAYVQPQQPKNS